MLTVEPIDWNAGGISTIFHSTFVHYLGPIIQLFLQQTKYYTGSCAWCFVGVFHCEYVSEVII